MKNMIIFAFLLTFVIIFSSSFVSSQLDNPWYRSSHLNPSIYTQEFNYRQSSFGGGFNNRLGFYGGSFNGGFGNRWGAGHEIIVPRVNVAYVPSEWYAPQLRRDRFRSGIYWNPSVRVRANGFF